VHVTDDDRTEDAQMTPGPDAGGEAPVYIPVLLYHAVNDVSRPGLADFTTTPDVFARHVAVLAGYLERGWTPMLATDLADALRGAIPMPAQPFAVTFDDGYDDNAAAIATLAAAGISSTIYVTASYVGQPGFLDAAELRRLAAEPLVEVGAHSVRHRRLDELSRAEIIGELRGGRSFLGDVTGIRISSVAYPHGNHDARVLDEVRNAGYVSGVAVKNALSRPGDDPLAIARWTVLSHHGPDEIAAVMDGYAPVVEDRERAQTRVYRHVRRLRARARALVGGAR
jgi:peptidoglycan/xylan/chitin deacetylase (PgdA/CDA1 family)